MNTAGIVQVPDPVLRQQCARVVDFDPEFRTQAARLLDAGSQPGRLGVAAPQIGLSISAFAASVHGPCRVFVNPVILERSGAEIGREGCLSVAEKWFQIERSTWVRLAAQDIHGEDFEIEARGWDARVVQHEVDHLQGTLVVDRVREQMQSLTRQQRRAAERQLAKAGA